MRTLLIALLPLTGCALLHDPLAGWHKLRPNMTEVDVRRTFGPPMWESSSGATEWRYCRSTNAVDTYVVVFFSGALVFDTARYTLDQFDYHDATGIRKGSCRDRIGEPGPAHVQRIRQEINALPRR